MKRVSLLKDLTGQLFGNWTVIRRYRNKRNGNRRRPTKWWCVCACGVQRAVFADSLKSGGSRSCGCLPKKSTAGTKRTRYYDLKGQAIGNWTVLRRAPNTGINTRWWCRCVCGVKRAVNAHTLRSGQSRSCGCLRPKPKMDQLVINLAGQTFGKLFVIERAPAIPNSRYAWWLVRCSCRKVYAVSGAALRSGQGSCGCVKPKHQKHGHTAIDRRYPDRDRHSPTYRSWRAMVDRCTNPNSAQWTRYGGNGITVCKRWRRSFVKFLGDMGERPEGHTLDRYPDKKGIYKPSNCRWATPAQQAANRETTVELRQKVQLLERKVARLKGQLRKAKAN